MKRGFINGICKKITLTNNEIDQLTTITHQRTLEAQIVDRAKMLLYKADGMTYSQIADRLDVNYNTVYLCIKKYNDGGIDRALYDDARSGRTSEITDVYIATMSTSALEHFPCLLV